MFRVKLPEEAALLYQVNSLRERQCEIYLERVKSWTTSIVNRCDWPTNFAPPLTDNRFNT